MSARRLGAGYGCAPPLFRVTPGFHKCRVWLRLGSDFMAVEINIAYEGGLHCTAVHGPSKKSLSTDAPVDNGGKGAAFSPTDLVATALGSCMVTIMGQVASRHNLNLEGLRVQVLKEMVADPVRRIGALKTRMLFPPGKPLSADDRARLEAAAHTCPVKKSLHPDVQTPVEFVYPDPAP